MGEFNVNKTTGGLDPTAGMYETYSAEQVMMSDGVTSVEEAIGNVVGGDATDFQAWGNNNGVVVFSVYIPALNQRIGIKRASDGTITSYIE